jgi:hypothetical protein
MWSTVPFFPLTMLPDPNTRLGPDGPFGCPTFAEQNDPNGPGRIQFFEHGQILWSPDQKLITGAFVDPFEGPRIYYNWQVRDQFNYDFFIIHWDKMTMDGTVLDTKQQDVEANTPAMRTSGRYSIQPDNFETYRITVEGCDHVPFPPFQPAKCRQKWSDPTVILGSWYLVPQQAPETDVASSQNNFFKRQMAILQFQACQWYDLAGTDINSDGGGDAWVAVALARLWYAEISEDPTQTFDPGNTGCVIGGRLLGNGMTASQLRDSVIAGLDVQKQTAVLGSAGDWVFPNKPENYDFVTRGLLPVAYGFEHLLRSRPCVHCSEVNVYEHVLHGLLGITSGPLLPSDLVAGPFPETENHILQIESSRYLTNQLLARDFQMNGQPVPPQYSNVTNGLQPSLLQYMQKRLQHDFQEYNARPYSGQTSWALQNLYDFADASDPVKTAAQILLDYLSAKVAVSSDALRRLVPFRRRAEYANWRSLVDNEADAQTPRFMMFTGKTDILPNIHATWNAHYYDAGSLEAAALTSYRVPDLILDFFFNRAHRQFFQRVHHDAVELYAAEPDFLITGGGYWVPSVHGFDEFNNYADVGVSMPTTLMAAGSGVTDRNMLIRFEGSGSNRNRVMTCVAPDFACGYNPVIPDFYLNHCTTEFFSIDGTKIPKPPVNQGYWTFLDMEGPKCTLSLTSRFYLAMFQAPCKCGVILTGFHVGDWVGLFEAEPVSLDVAFELFIHRVLTANSHYSLDGGSSNATNTYHYGFGDRRVNFTLDWSSDKSSWQILSYLVNGIPSFNLETDITRWPLAVGDVIKSGGGVFGTDPCCVTIMNKEVGRSLFLNFTNWQNPQEQ